MRRIRSELGDGRQVNATKGEKSTIRCNQEPQYNDSPTGLVTELPDQHTWGRQMLPGCSGNTPISHSGNHEAIVPELRAIAECKKSTSKAL